jgi:uncharacterized membrane protein YqiK
MLDEYEIKLSQKHRMFKDSQNQSEQDRRNQQRRVDSSTRRRLQERRQQQLLVEVERRREQRRIAERRSPEERRVTSNYSHDRLVEERERLKSKNEKFDLGEVLIFLAIAAAFTMLITILNNT